jgi:hypothetical protein
VVGAEKREKESEGEQAEKGREGPDLRAVQALERSSIHRGLHHHPGSAVVV